MAKNLDDELYAVGIMTRRRVEKLIREADEAQARLAHKFGIERPTTRTPPQEA